MGRNIKSIKEKLENKGVKKKMDKKGMSWKQALIAGIIIAVLYLLIRGKIFG